MSDPLVSVIMPCYQQERYVAQALRSVMAQTYQPLEIIIADDCSTDRTYTVLQEVVASASCPHRIVLGRNERNCGIENYNVLLAQAKGAFIVHAHGDDVSAPDRVARLVKRWRRSGASLVTSNAIVIDAEGRRQSLYFALDAKHDLRAITLARMGLAPTMLGAAFGYERAVIERFGPFDRMRSAIRTDMILPFRASLLKGISVIKQPLLSFRRHESTARRMMRGDLGDLEWDEVRYAEVAIQFYYMIETLGKAGSLDLPPAEQQAVREELRRSLTRVVGLWRSARNRLLAEGWRCNWMKKA